MAQIGQTFTIYDSKGKKKEVFILEEDFDKLTNGKFVSKNYKTTDLGDLPG